MDQGQESPSRGVGGEDGGSIEAAALLSQIQMMESKLGALQHFGHPPPPKILMCRIPDSHGGGVGSSSGMMRPGIGVFATMVYTQRCASAQLLKESVDFSSVGAPIEVLMLSDSELITCASMVALEYEYLSADDTLIVPDRSSSFNDEKEDDNAVSLMTGGVIPVAASARVSMIFGTSAGRVLSVEFAVNVRAMQLTRRDNTLGDQMLPYFLPLPHAVLTSKQQQGAQLNSGGRRRSKVGSSSSSNPNPNPLYIDGQPVVPFEPKGGVVSIAPYLKSSKFSKAPASVFVWISFSDGQIVRLHHAGFFPSVVQQHNEIAQEMEPTSLEHRISAKAMQMAVMRYQVTMPDISNSNLTVIPIPSSHPSPLAPLQGAFDFAGADQAYADADMDVDGANESKIESLRLSQGDEIYEAAVYSSDYIVDGFPTVAFFTSEDQYDGTIAIDPVDTDVSPESNVIGTVIGGAVSLLGGVVGGLFTSAKSSIRPSAKEQAQQKAAVAQDETRDRQSYWDPCLPFPSINAKPKYLFCGAEVHDHPRRITHFTIEPNGKLAAFSDTLGRVSLVDLSTKQIIRMWKGYRDTTCEWMQVPQNRPSGPWRKSMSLYLVVHSKQRRVVEVWKTRHGPKVKSLQVGRDAQLVSCREMSNRGYVTNCYLAHSNIAFSSMNQIEKISLSGTDQEKANLKSTQWVDRSIKDSKIDQYQDDSARLQRLQQLLGNMNIVCQSIDIFKAFQNIGSIKDLAVALDLIAVAPVLEERMGVEGSTFQRLAVSHCRQKLEDAIKRSDGEAISNPHIQILAFKIAYFSQIIRAFDLLHKFEMDLPSSSREKQLAPQSDWAIEAVGWTSTYDRIHKPPQDADDPPSQLLEPIKFAVFAKACEPPRSSEQDKSSDPHSAYKIYFSDSSKTRKDILVHCFRPLLGDTFSFGVVGNLLQALGLSSELDYHQKCFGEWFMSLPLKEATQNALFVAKSSISRWLQDMVNRQLDDKRPLEKGIALHALFDFCRKREDLVRAFYLATLCRDSVSKVAKQQEESTYGKITSKELVEPWEKLLRKLRMCLLVTLRLNGMRLGAEPVTVHSVEREGTFSVLKWLALDELKISHDFDEIVSLEKACKISTHSFNPCDASGDEPAKWKALHRSCVASSISEEERAEFLVDYEDEERLGPLLLYLRPYNRPEWLAAHRALLLASEWGKNPKSLNTLKAAVASLDAIPVNQDYKALSNGIRLNVWQTSIRPILRALLVGFDDVQEISATVVAPLFEQRKWLTSFGKIAGNILNQLAEVKWEYGEDPNDFSAVPSITRIDQPAVMQGDDMDEKYSNDFDESRADHDAISNANASANTAADIWPPLHDDHSLKRLVEKARTLEESAVNAHQMLISAVLVSSDTSTLSECVPSFFDLFNVQSLFSSVTPLSDPEEKRHEFMQDAIVHHARTYHGPTLDSLELGEIDTLAALWDFDPGNIRTLFLLVMYEFGKDRIVDELLTKCSEKISVHHFCQNGVDIICRRLNDVLHVRQRSEIQNVMGGLDADVCEWIRERAEGSEPLISGNLSVPLQDTHLFALRLLSLAAVAEISKEERIKVHSLIVLSGTLVKAVEEAMATE